MVTCTKYFHVRPVGSYIDIMFRAEYFEVQDHGWIGFWVGDLLCGSCWAQDITQICYMDNGSQICVKKFDVEGKYGI